MRYTIFLLSIPVLLGAGSFLLPITSAAACQPTISRILRVGARGEDVRALQKFLNTDASAPIAASGVGSPGNESNYFGPATLRAVMKFQEKNRDSILVPAGVSAPTGIIGKFMSSFINDYYCANPAASDVGTTGSTSSTNSSDAAANLKRLSDLRARSDALFAESNKQMADIRASAEQHLADSAASINQAKASFARFDKIQGVLTALSDPSYKFVPGVSGGAFGVADPLQVTMILPSLAKRGTRIGIVGSGFLEKNTLYVGTRAIAMEMPNADGTVAYAQLPADVPAGNTEVSVENTKGKSAPVPFVVTSEQSAAPVISNFTPLSATIGGTVTLSGSNFLSKNDIYTSLGVISDVPSGDGKTITFTVSAPSALLDTSGKLVDSVPFTVLVGNDNGLSNSVQMNMQ